MFVKHFELATDETRPEMKRRLETRLLVCDADGGVYGVDLQMAAGQQRRRFAGDQLERGDCDPDADRDANPDLVLSEPAGLSGVPQREGGLVLGVKTRQLNRDFEYSAGHADNQLRAWNHLGLFEPKLAEATLPIRQFGARG